MSCIRFCYRSSLWETGTAVTAVILILAIAYRLCGDFSIDQLISAIFVLPLVSGGVRNLAYRRARLEVSAHGIALQGTWWPRSRWSLPREAVSQIGLYQEGSIRAVLLQNDQKYYGELFLESWTPCSGRPETGEKSPLISALERYYPISPLTQIEYAALYRTGHVKVVVA